MMDETNVLTAPLSDIPTFNIKYFTMYKVHIHAGVIRKLLYGCAYVQKIIRSLFDARRSSSRTYAQSIQ